MKANELQIGDWVKDKYKLKPHKVDSWADFNNAEDLSPIPLTPEILEKNLEKECEDTIDGGLYFNAENSRIWGILDEKGFWLNFNGQQDMILIHYAHELQHALRLCGLTDLADNFKVE